MSKKDQMSFFGFDAESAANPAKSNPPPKSESAELPLAVASLAASGAQPASSTEALPNVHETMAQTLKSAIDTQVKRGKIRPREGVDLTDFYESCLKSYTYLKK